MWKDLLTMQPKAGVGPMLADCQPCGQQLMSVRQPNSIRVLFSFLTNHIYNGSMCAGTLNLKFA